MKSRRFRPIGIDALEDRMVLTAFSSPFTLVTPPSSEVNPKFLVLTKHTETEISYAITASFDRFAGTFNKGLKAYEKAISKTGADAATIEATFESKVSTALTRLDSDLLAVSRKVPFGAVNLNPVFENRVAGTTGVTDTTTGVNTPSLQVQLQDAFAAGDATAAESAITSTQMFVRSDLKDYINLGVTNGYFKLGKGAILPQIT